MYTLFTLYDSFFQYANRPMQGRSSSLSPFPVTALNVTAQYRNASSFAALPKHHVSQRKKAVKEKTATSIFTEMTGKGRWLNERV